MTPLCVKFLNKTDVYVTFKYVKLDATLSYNQGMFLVDMTTCWSMIGFHAILPALSFEHVESYEYPEEFLRQYFYFIFIVAMKTHTHLNTAKHIFFHSHVDNR